MVILHIYICHQKLAKLLNLQRGAGSNFPNFRTSLDTIFPPSSPRFGWADTILHQWAWGLERKEPWPINIKNLWYNMVGILGRRGLPSPKTHMTIENLGKSTIWRGISYGNWGFFNVMVVFRGVDCWQETIAIANAQVGSFRPFKERSLGKSNH